ncbi:hypothetical protein BH11PSE8_BH11PSE8_20030 [soil metagenome]
MNESNRNDAHPRLALLVERFAHPSILVTALAGWWYAGRTESASFVILFATLLLATALEFVVPAVPSWRPTPAARMRLIGVYALGFGISMSLVGSYAEVALPAVADLRERAGANVWPHHWPMVAQVLLLFFLAELFYYWVHRAIHRWAPLWRVLGHGFHHGFQNLHVTNAGANHPFELVLLVVPLLLIPEATGAPADVVGGTATLLMVNATLAHANLRMQTPGFGLFFTSSNQHRRHHSAVFEESNTNFACNAIIWDRIFGTYSSGAVQQTGIGPTQPALWRLFMLPMREPTDADTIASRGQSRVS